MKIAFHSNQLCERGTEVALFDYAKHCQEFVGVESYIISNQANINKQVYERFALHFNMLLYSDFHAEIDKLLAANRIDMLYMIKKGKDDGMIAKDVKTVIHAVFNCTEPHGDVYATISEWMSRGAKDFGYEVPYVPHMIDLPKFNGNLRRLLGIPEDATVFGRHGGFNEFNIEFVQEVVKQVLKERDDVYFLFMNTKAFLPRHSRVFNLPLTVEPRNKVAFINTCDAMLHARTRGETFGLAVGEFSARNKPVFTWTGSKELSHVDILGSHGLYYSYEKDLYVMMNSFADTIKDQRGRMWDVYSERFSPERVMDKFKQVFMQD